MMKKKFNLDDEMFDSTFNSDIKHKKTEKKETKRKDSNDSGEYVDFTEIKDNK